MNLIYDPWIPVRRADGSREIIAPWQLTEGIADNPIVAVASPRPDFDGALTQFLIGLLQTTCPPENASAWRLWRQEPPLKEVLLERFETIKSAFDFGSEGAVFMQDLTLGPTDFQKKTKRKLPANADDDEEEGLTPIASLLIEAPGKITKDQNRDHFIKRDVIIGLCPCCTASALFTLQTNSPGRGSGYRTSIRGGGPLTTIIIHDGDVRTSKSLWTTCWLNVLDRTRWLSGRSGNPDKQVLSERFPWLARTRTSENDEGVTTPDDIHPDQQYWAMPQRIRLAMAKQESDARCDLCGSNGQPLYRHYYTKKFGISYKGDFRHPLSPYDLIDGHPRTVLTDPGGIGYRHWLGLIENEANSVRQRATVIERFVMESPPQRREALVWAFGFDIYNSNKVRGWTDAQLPIFDLPKEVRDLFVPIVKNMVVVSNRVCGMTLRSILRASFFKPKGKKQKRGKAGNSYTEIIWGYPKPLKKFNKAEEDMDKIVLNEQRALMYSSRSAFWDNTEQKFIVAMRAIKDALGSSDRNAENEILERWLNDLRKEARHCLELFSASGDFDGVDPRRLALAEYELNGALSNPQLRELLGLPKSTHKAA